MRIFANGHYITSNGIKIPSLTTCDSIDSGKLIFLNN